MDKLQQREYDFFMRMAALAQQKVMELAPLRDDPGAAGKLFRQYIDDMENCKYYARGIAEGYVFVHRPQGGLPGADDNVPQGPASPPGGKVEREPVDESNIPPKYR